MIATLESITLGVSGLEAALALFRDALGLSVVNDARVSVGQLAAWRRPVHEGARLVELGRPGSSCGRVRLAEFELAGPAPDGRDARAPSWFLDLSVGDALDEAIERCVRRGCVRRAGPARYGLGTLGLEQALLAAPDELALRLTRLYGGASGEAQDRPTASVCIATADLEASRRFYGDALGFALRVEDELTVSGDAEPSRLFGDAKAPARFRLAAFGAPADSGHTVMLAELPGGRDAPRAREMSPGRPGIELLTCSCEDMDEVVKRLDSLGVEAITRPTHIGLPIGRPGRVMLVRGPNGELIELTEIAA